MKRVYTLPDGRSAWGTVEVPLSDNLGEIGVCSPVFGGQGVIFRHTPGDYAFSAHNAPREQIIVNLNAGVDVETGRDGVRGSPQSPIHLLHVKENHNRTLCRNKKKHL